MSPDTDGPIGEVRILIFDIFMSGVIYYIKIGYPIINWQLKELDFNLHRIAYALMSHVRQTNQVCHNFYSGYFYIWSNILHREIKAN